MSELTEEQRAFLVGPDARMDGYYIGFDKTGVDVIDQILSAVAYAAKGAHKTEAWSHELVFDYGPVPADKTFEWLIQEAANDAAERLAAAGFAPQREPEYEYGPGYKANGRWFSLDGAFTVREAAEHSLNEYADDPQVHLVRRVKAGAWEPVPNQSVSDDGHDGWCGCERCEPNQSDGDS